MGRRLGSDERPISVGKDWPGDEGFLEGDGRGNCRWEKKLGGSGYPGRAEAPRDGLSCSPGRSGLERQGVEA